MLTQLILLCLTVSVGVCESGIELNKFCPEITFNYAYKKYEILMPIRVRGSSAGDKIEVTLQDDPSVMRRRSSSSSRHSMPDTLSVSIRSGPDESRMVSLQCKTFQRCKELRIAIASDASAIRDLLMFKSGFHTQILARVPSSSLVRSNCNSGWKVFQQRVDGSLSFAQNYKTYERGFGDPRGNYWMGLHSLHAATGSGLGYSTCRFRVTALGNNKIHYKAEYSHFQVLHSGVQYKLLLSGPAKGNTIYNIEYHNGMRFSTYDRDHDTWKLHCSQYCGNGGWWYNACYRFNPNGQYTRLNEDRPDVSAAMWNHRIKFHQSFRRIRMEFKCD